MKALLFIVAFSTLAAGTLHPQTITLIATKDAFVAAASPDSNYGGAGTLAVAAPGLASGEFDTVVAFDLSPVRQAFDTLYGASLWTVVSLRLQFTANSPTNSIFNGHRAGPNGSDVNFAGQYVVKRMQNTSWIEGTGTPKMQSPGISFNTLPLFLSAADEDLGTFSFDGATSGNVTISLNLTPSLQNDAEAGNVVSFLAAPADADVALLANSRSFGNVSSRPVLIVSADAAPEPGSAALVAGGLCFFALGRRRRSREQFKNSSAQHQKQNPIESSIG